MAFIPGVQNKLMNLDESIYIPVTKAEFAVLNSAFNVRFASLNQTDHAWEAPDAFSLVVSDGVGSDVYLLSYAVYLAIPFRLARLRKQHKTRGYKPWEYYKS